MLPLFFFLGHKIPAKDKCLAHARVVKGQIKVHATPTDCFKALRKQFSLTTRSRYEDPKCFKVKLYASDIPKERSVSKSVFLIFVVFLSW